MEAGSHGLLSSTSRGAGFEFEWRDEEGRAVGAQSDRVRLRPPDGVCYRPTLTV